MGQINDAVNDMDRSTQHNAALVEEMAAAAAALSQRARELVGTVASFRLPGERLAAAGTLSLASTPRALLQHG